MKRGVIFLILLFIIPYAIADITVTLNSPDGNVINSKNATFNCSITGDAELASISLYFGKEATWHSNKSVTVTGQNASASFEIYNIANNNYIWNCKATAANGSESFSTQNKTFSINAIAAPPAPPVVNNPPQLVREIPDKKWYKDESSIMIMQDYFKDPENTNMQFSAAGNVHIAINISNGIATLTPEKGWTGSEKVTFTANDGQSSVTSNEALLNVTEKIVQSQPLTIAAHFPIESKAVSAKQGDVFYVNATNGNVSYSWLLDGNDAGTNRIYALTNIQPGKHNLTVTATNTKQSASFTWEININGAPKATTNAKQAEAAPQCGNKKPETGENCETCPSDAACEKGFNCVKGGKCQKKSIMPTIAAIIFIIFALTTGGYFSYEYLLKGKINLFKKKDEEKIETKTAETKNSEPKEAQKNIEPEKKPEAAKPLVTINNPQNKQAQAKPAAKKGDLLKEYIQKMLDKGHTREEVYQNLIKAGWPKAKIDESLKSQKVNKQPKAGL